MKKLVAALACLALVSPAYAGFSTGVQAGPFDSNGPAPLAFSQNPGVADFVPGVVNFSGIANGLGSGSWQSELRLIIQNPAGETCASGVMSTIFGSPAPGNPPGAWSSNVSLNTSFSCSGALPTTVGNGSGSWNFFFGESFNDGGSTLIDAQWTSVSISIGDGVPPPPPDPISSLPGFQGTISGSFATNSLTTVGGGDDTDGPNGMGGGGSWSGEDHAWKLNWGGGDLIIDLLFSDAAGDLDLQLFADSLLNTLIDNSSSVSDNENVTVLGAAAGMYWITIDGWQGDTNHYGLTVTPEPTTGALIVLGLGGMALIRRRR